MDDEVLDNEARISVAEHVMERAGLAGQSWTVWSGHTDNPEYQQAMEPLRAIAYEVVGYRVGVQCASPYLVEHKLGSAVAMVTAVGSILLRPGVVNLLTLLHECAHLIDRETGGIGHSNSFIEVAAELYSTHISAEAGQVFTDLAKSPDAAT